MRSLESEENYVEYVPKGAKNSRVAQLAKEKKAILITRDSDFANTLAYPPGGFYGIIVLYIHPPKSELLVKALSNVLTKVNEFEGKLFLIEKSGFKVVE
jgi:predicted nuclease of predicted toxin-antitoxin system